MLVAPVTSPVAKAGRVPTTLRTAFCIEATIGIEENRDARHLRRVEVADNSRVLGLDPRGGLCDRGGVHRCELQNKICRRVLLKDKRRCRRRPGRGGTATAAEQQDRRDERG